MANKILSQAGISLADAYDVEGSIAGVEDLDSESVKTVHEMGATIFSERFSTQIFSILTGDLNQSTTIGVGLAGLPTVPTRILGLVVITNVTARIANVTVSLSTTVGTVEEFPIWTWSSGGGETTARFVIGGASGNQILLDSNLQYDRIPMIRAGTDQPQSIQSLVLRGATSAFGAGTVELELRALLAFSDIGGISSYGLPIPSW